MLLQAITIDDRLYEVDKAARTFANTHIFPGGCLPSAGLIADCVSRVTDLRPIWLEDQSAHYALTLAAWRRRFLAAWEELSLRGFDERFKRLWLFYLSSSEAGFRERRLGDLQLLYAKPRWRGDDLAPGEPAQQVKWSAAAVLEGSSSR
jgi:cyclopropane-fatty-acyl-phospholipid synthase